MSDGAVMLPCLYDKSMIKCTFKIRPDASTVESPHTLSQCEMQKEGQGHLL